MSAADDVAGRLEAAAEGRRYGVTSDLFNEGAAFIRSQAARIEKLEEAAKRARMMAGIHRQAYLDARYGSSFAGVEIPGDDEWWSFHQAMADALERT